MASPIRAAAATGATGPRAVGAQVFTWPSKFSKLLIRGGSPSNPSSRHLAHTDSYTSFFSRLRREKVLMYLYSLHALMMHLEPQGRISGGFWLGSREGLPVSRRMSMGGA